MHPGSQTNMAPEIFWPLEKEIPDGPAISFKGPAISFKGPAISFKGPAISFQGPAISFKGPAISLRVQPLV